MTKILIKVVMCMFAWLFCLQSSLAADTWSYPSKEPDKSLGGGNGDAYNPYLIKTAQQLADFAWLVNNGDSYSGEYVALAANITLNDIIFNDNNEPTNLKELKAWTNIGEYGFWSNDYFKGFFDGRGHTISGLYVNADKDEYTGLFGALYGKVSNLNIKDSYILGDGGNDATGFLVGYMKCSVINNCHISNSHINIATNTSSNIGGIAGQGSGDGKVVLASSFSGTMNIHHSSGTVYVAGIMGLGAPKLENCRVDGQMNLYAVKSDSKDEIYANGLCYEAADITGCVNNLNFKVQNEGGSSKLHTLDLNTLCKTAQNVSKSANLGSVQILSTDGWQGMVGNIFRVDALEDCAFYGSFNGTSVNRSTSGKLTFYYLGEQDNYIKNPSNNVFLCKDGYTFVSSNTERFDRKIVNLTPGSYDNGVYAYPEDKLKADDILSSLNSESTTFCVWGKTKGRGDLLDGCPLPVVCGGVLDADLKGEGTEESPWLIGSEAELRKLAADVNAGKVDTEGKFFALTADIDMTNSEVFEPIGNSEKLPFLGTFDGQGHVISGIKIKNLGMFGYGDGCTLKRLAVVGAEFEDTSLDRCAVLLGHGVENKFSNYVDDCYVGGDIKISADNFSVAGIVGSTDVAYINNSYFKGRYIVDSKNSATNTLSGISCACGYMSYIENCYASFSVVAPDDMDIKISGISNIPAINAKNNYSVCGQINQHGDNAEDEEYMNGKICDNDSKIFADSQFPADSPWQKGVFRPVLKDAKNYVATAADGTDTEAYYDAIAMADSNNPSNDIFHYTLKDGEENDKLLWALPNLAIYTPEDKSEYIINCTLNPAKPLNYNTKASCKAEAVKANMRYSLALETGKHYYMLCLPGTVQSDNLPSGSALYIGGEVKDDGDGNRYMDIVRVDSVEGGIPFVAYVPNPTTGETLNILMRSRMAPKTLKSISDGEHTQNFALTGTYKGGAMSNVCNKLVESDGKVYLTKVAGEQTVLPFTAYLENEEKVELCNYVLLDEMSNETERVLGEVDGTTMNVMLERTLRSDGWNTICLPFDMTVEEVEAVFGEGTKVEAYAWSEVKDGVITFRFDSPAYNRIYSGYFYLIKPGTSGNHYLIPNRALNNVLIPVGGPFEVDGTQYNVKLCGTYARKMLGTGEEGNDEYFIQNNKIMHVANGRQIPMNGFRGYITANEAAANALSKARIVHSDGSTTDLRLVEVGSNADGSQRIYDLQGIEQSSDSQQRGVYIKGGRKYVK